MARRPFVPAIYILHGEEASDRALAGDITRRIAGLPAAPQLVSSEQLVDHYKESLGLGLLREASQILPGTLVAVLSPTLLANPERRAALVAAVGGTAFIDFRQYFICRGLTPQDVRSRFPDLATIYENVMLIPESGVDQAIDNLKQNFGRDLPNRSVRGIQIFLYTSIGLVLSVLSNRIYRYRLLLATGAGLSLYLDWSSNLAIVLTAACFFASGVGLSRADPLDLWPWLARCWKWPESNTPHALPSVVPFEPISMAGMVFGSAAAIMTGDQWSFLSVLVPAALLQLAFDRFVTSRAAVRFRRAKAAHPADTPADASVCSEDHLRVATSTCMTLRNFNLWWVFGSILLLLVPAAIGAARFPLPFAFVWLGAFVAGLAVPTIAAAAWLTASAETLRVKGLTTEQLERTARDYSRSNRGAMPYPMGIEASDLASFTEPQKEELKGFQALLRVSGGQSMRPWFERPDFAFISYVWGDEANARAAERLDMTLGAAGIPRFRDKRDIKNPYVAWRQYVAAALVRCSHFFLIVSPGIRHAGVVYREIQSVILRWHLELQPAVICVVNPQDARAMREDTQLSLHLRFLLTCCPQMTPSEAADPGQVRYIVELTRRQGRWRDWMTLLSRPAAGFHILRMPGIVRKGDG